LLDFLLLIHNYLAVINGTEVTHGSGVLASLKNGRRKKNKKEKDDEM